MIPVVTVDEMSAIDAAFPDGEDVLIRRAGWAVSRVAKEMLGGTYGRHIAVVAGPGNNGADGRVAAELLLTAGASVTVHQVGEVIPACDLVIDAAYGTGFRGDYIAPVVEGAKVLAVDIPSGVFGNTGIASDTSVKADVTVAFAALKPGHLFHGGSERSGQIQLVDIGLDVTTARIHVVENADVANYIPQLSRESHKWKSALQVVAGSPGMMGAATFTSAGALRAGAGMVHLRTPGLAIENASASEAVVVRTEETDWHKSVLKDQERMNALVIGPGLGRSNATIESVRSVVASSALPVLIDGDGLFAIADDYEHLIKERSHPTVLTPHDGEYKTLTGKSPGDNRIESARELATNSGAYVLLKGSSTVVASPQGDVLVSIAGDSRLATAGTGDVLSGVVGAFLSQEVDPLWAAALGAHIHGQAARLGLRNGLIASDLPELVARCLTSIRS